MPSDKPRIRRGMLIDGATYLRFLELGRVRQEHNRKHATRRARLRYDANREKFTSRERYTRHKRNRGRHHG